MGRLGYHPPLDGLRGVAILLVLAFHAGALPGGFLGVDAFFVLSGFLITALLLAEWDADGAISLRGFYARRARRLFPALGALLAATLALLLLGYSGGVIGPGGLLVGLRNVAFGAFYVTNFAEAAGLELAPLSHLWSLAAEEQFYVVWPLVLLFCLRRRVRPGVLCAWLGVIALVVAANRATGAALGVSSDWLLASPFTRSDPIVVGCIAGILYSARLTPPRLVSSALVPFAAVATVGAVVAAAYPWERAAFVLGLVPFELAVALAILVVVERRGARLATLLAFSPLVLVGKISYSLYLWHPLFMRESLSTPGLVVAVALTFAAAVASYHLVEKRFRRSRPREEPQPASLVRVSV